MKHSLVSRFIVSKPQDFMEAAVRVISLPFGCQSYPPHIRYGVSVIRSGSPPSSGSRYMWNSSCPSLSWGKASLFPFGDMRP